ncbi:ribosome maturation factor RimM [Variovorax sp. OV329]|uniref:ribosome maturation factor RimM n=1 Tax=Variovorax sp. OV329 TaxID=1882825 RepID=UPI0008E26117|nr:ribosome maturation factor RimM [Variovorax sp. OV329]SFM07806.1 16S rRNA processing protein RimM [Variovorax sp. OV329]
MLPALEAAELPADAIEVGRIADAWGIKGWFKVLPHSAQPEALFSSKRWFLKPPGAVAGATAAFRLPISEAKEHSDCIVATSPEVPDRNAAEALRGARVFVPRSSFPSVGDDEYYWVDLIGLAVVNREGVALGTVRELLATGPQTTLVLELPGEGENAKPVERMIPFVGAFVDKVDLAGRTILVDWQADF